MELKDIILQERTKKNYTQKELADKANVQQSLVARCEAGLSDPKFSTGIALLNALNYDLSQLNKPSIITPDDIALRLTKLLAPFFKVSYQHIYIDDVDSEHGQQPLYDDFYLCEAVSDVALANIDIKAGYQISLGEQDVEELINQCEANTSKALTSVTSECYTTAFKKLLNDELLDALVFNNRIATPDTQRSKEELLEITKGNKRISSDDIDSVKIQFEL